MGKFGVSGSSGVGLGAGGFRETNGMYSVCEGLSPSPRGHERNGNPNRSHVRPTFETAGLSKLAAEVVLLFYITKGRSI